MSVSVAARNRAIALWLFAIIIMVFVMVVLGGLTRLTHSGLSMVDWKPLTGWLPPLSEAEWQRIFDDYRQFPQYLKLNKGMSLADFKDIFWLEFIHRVWGRLIGIAFFVPMVFFMWRGWMRGAMAWKVVGLFVLGGMQGVMGWYMVKSGLVDHPDVSQYRLTAHFSLALVIICYALWLIFDLLTAERGPGPTLAKGLSRAATGLAVLVFITALSGGFVAGLDAGFAYNTFPDMGGEWIPTGLFHYDPVWLAPFEDITTVQFDHRVLALTTFALILAFWVRVRRRGVSGPARRAVSFLALTVSLQVLLGISTLLLVVPISLAALHQAVAVVLVGVSFWVALEFRRGRA